MPSVKYNLASQRLPGSNALGGQLRASGLNAGAGGNLRAPSISANAANVQYTPAPIPPIVVDTTLDSAASFSKVLVDSAFRYQELEAQAQADQEILSIQEKLDQAAIKYGQTYGQVSVDTYDAFSGEVDQITKGALDNLSPSAKAKATTRLAKLKNNTTAAGAQHKAQQFQVWQGEILQAQENKTITDIIDTGTDPKITEAAYNSHMDNIANRYPGQEAKASVEQQKFKDKMFSTLADTYVTMGSDDPSYYSLASHYLTVGAKEGANPVMLAKGHEAIETAIIQDENRAYKAEVRAGQIADKQNQEMGNALLNQAIASNNPAMLNQIADPKMRSAAMNIMSNINRGVASDPEAKNAMWARRSEFAQAPWAVLNEGMFYGVNAQDKKEFFDSLWSDRKNGVSDAKKISEDWIDAILPDPIMSGVAGKTQIAGINATRQRLQNMFSDAVDDAVLNKTSVDGAIYKVQKEILTDPFFKDNYSAVKLNRQNLGNLTHGHGMMGLEHQLAAETDPITRYNMAKTSFDNASQRLMSAYGVGSFSDIGTALAGNPQAQRDLLRDSAMLLVHRKYYFGLAADVTQDTNDLTDLGL